MKPSILQTLGWFAFISLISTIPQPVTAQPITPAADGTGTLVTPDGQRYDIQGGTLSRDGANLFHSFQQFGLNQGETANFITNPQIQNILGRVVGGDPSIINGLIQITGGNSNLFLMNPAGILFGPNASLNIPADFTATTASGIGFGNSWFNSFGTSDYANLVGTPSAFSFNMSQLGTIINEGNLTLTNGSNLNLFANTVINNGTLATPGGNINITAIPSDSPLSKGGQGGSILRISQPGHILSLEIDTQKPGFLEKPGFLADRLTGGDPLHHATTVQKLDDGTIRLTGSQTPIPLEPGITVVSGNMSVATEQMTFDQGQMTILGDKIALIGTNIDASGTNGAGNIHIGGNYQGAGPLPNANHTYIDQNTNISANAISSGNGGQIIIWSDNTTQFHGNISATGIENGGFVEVSGKQNLIFRGKVDLSAPNGQTGTLLLDPQNITIVNASGGANDSQLSDNQILFSDAGITFTISETKLESLNGNATVELQATNNITIEDLTDDFLAFKPGSGAIIFTADADNDGSGAFTMMDVWDTIFAPGRSVTINAATITLGNINTTSSSTNGGDITLNATGDIIAGNIMSVAHSQAGAINITSSGGGIILFDRIYSGSLYDSGGDITISANGNIITTDIWADGAFNQGNPSANSGNITITSLNGAIDTTAGSLTSVADGNGGNIQLIAAGDIRTGGIDSSVTGAGTGGSISLESTGGIIDTSLGLLDSHSETGVGGNVSLQAASDIINAGIDSGGEQQGGDVSIISSGGEINLSSDIFAAAPSGSGGNITVSADGNITANYMSSLGDIQAGEINISSSNGEINLLAEIYALSPSGSGADINLNAAGNITANYMSSRGDIQAGAINITSSTGEINLLAEIYAISLSGYGGDINVNAPGNITANHMTSRGDFQAGTINITSSNGEINLLSGIYSSSQFGSGGDITLTAQGNITTHDEIWSDSYGGVNYKAGNITLTSGGAIDATGSYLSAWSSGDAGNIQVTAAGNIRTGNIDSDTFAGKGGSISLESTGGTIDTTGGLLSSHSDGGVGGDVTITADGNITLGGDANNSGIRSTGYQQQSGDITITSINGEIDASRGMLEARSINSNAGNITLEAKGNITTTHIDSHSPAADAGAIQIISNNGNINTTLGILFSQSDDGNAGNVTLQAAGNITTGHIGSDSVGAGKTGGNITLESTGGAIDTTAGWVTSFADGNGGNVRFAAAGNIRTGDLYSDSRVDGVGGNISLESTGGTIETVGGLLNSYSFSGVGGNVTITAPGNITIGGDANSRAIRTEGLLGGGNITITSSLGEIDTSQGSLKSNSPDGNAGNVTIEAEGNITTTVIDSYSNNANAGEIKIISHNGAIDTTGGELTSWSDFGSAGDVTLQAAGNITTSDIWADGEYNQGNSHANAGNITIESTGGAIDTTAGWLTSFASSNGGDVKFTAAGDIRTGDIESYALGSGTGGSISLESTGGVIDTSLGLLKSYSIAGVGGEITLQAAGDITNADLLSSGGQQGGHITITSNNGLINAANGNLDSFSSDGNAGNVTLNATGNITTQNIRSYGAITGGNLTVNSGGSFTNSGTIHSYASDITSGVAGNVNIDTASDITLGSDANNSAIQSEGGQQGGSITITSDTGKITATGDLNLFSASGTAGNVTLDAPGNIDIANILSYGDTKGGSISITTDTSLDLTGNTLNSYSETGEAGDVSITANGNITLGGNANNSAIRSDGAQLGGNISITTNNGEINATAGNLDSSSANGTAGNVILDATGNITTQNIRSEGAFVGGKIDITTGGSFTTIGTINSYASNATTGEAGDVNITADGNINLGGDANNSAIRSEGATVGGNISITTTSGAINANAGNLDSYSAKGTAGSVNLDAATGIDIANIRSEGDTVGGSINITSDTNLDFTGSTLNSYSETGEAGDVAITANGNITLGGDASNSAIRSEGSQVGGNISITSNTGEINATAGNLDSYSTNGTAGNVTLESAGNIATSNIRSQGATVGGNIDITTGGSFTTTGTINSYASNATTGEAGDVNITANSDITLGGDANNSAIRSEGATVGGNISITTTSGAINANAGNLDSYSAKGTAGSVNLDAATGIDIANIRSEGDTVGGSINITSDTNLDFTGSTLNSYSENGQAGDVNVTANGNITLGGDASNSAIRSEGSLVGGNISITSNTGEINATAGNLDSYSTNGTAGNVTLESSGSIATASIRSDGKQTGGIISITSNGGAIDTTGGDLSSYSDSGMAGNVILNAGGGNVTTGNIDSKSPQVGGKINITSAGDLDTSLGDLLSYSTTGTAGDITLYAAGCVTTGDIRTDGAAQAGSLSITSCTCGIDTSLGTLTTYSTNGTAGDVILDALNGVTTGDITSYGNTASGNVSIQSDSGNISTNHIQTISPTGVAGNVTLNTFSHNGDILTANITSQGGTLAGDISVKAPDGSVTTGDIASISQSGDAGDIDVSAGEDVETGDITSSGGNNSGDINVGSDNGGVTTDNIGTVAENGDSGDVTVGASDNVQTGDITSSAGNNSGDITVGSDNAGVTTDNIGTVAENGDSGDVTVGASDNVQTGDITSSGGNNSGDINVNSSNGGVTTENIATVAKNGDSGDVALGAWDNILTGDITSAAGNNSGDINVNSSNAGVTTENIATVAQNGDSGNVMVGALDNVQTGNITSTAGNNSGDINVSSSNAGVTTENLTTIADNGDSGNVGVVGLDDIQTGDITSVAGNNSGDIGVNSGNGSLTVGNLESGAVNGDSGNIALSGFEDVTAGNISSAAGGNSGDIDVNSTTGGIVAGDIESQAASGMGGNISFDADQNINTGRIISNGAIGGGDINLTSANGTITTGEIYTATGKININYPGQVDSRNMLANLAVASSGSSIVNADAVVASLEQSLTDEYSEYFGGNLAQKLNTTASIREAMSKIAAETGYKSAIIYVMAQQDQLELILFLGTGNVIRKTVPEAPREQLMATVEKFRQQLTVKRLGKRTNGYLQPSQQLYQWLITPIEAELQAAGINTLLFSMDVGLRSLPMAALHDGQQFLVEKYSMSLIPSMSLIDPRYRHLKDTRVLGMGASNFQDLGPLPAVPVELSAVTEDLWQGDEYLNETFTRNNLVEQRQNNPYPIIHLATHGEFQPGLPENSYIQLWGEEKLRLDQLRELGWNNPPVELLVLSACRTALGDEQAELGFAGFAVAAGVKTALASLWYVSDEGSLALMTEFYRNLEAAKIKGEALRQAQLAMIRGDVDVTGGSLRNSAVASAIALPPELAGVENHELSHPYYWSAFTMIGSPW